MFSLACHQLNIQYFVYTSILKDDSHFIRNIVIIKYLALYSIDANESVI